MVRIRIRTNTVRIWNTSYSIGDKSLKSALFQKIANPCDHGLTDCQSSGLKLFELVYFYLIWITSNNTHKSIFSINL
jgi:hypothetical protein